MLQIFLSQHHKDGRLKKGDIDAAMECFHSKVPRSNLFGENKYLVP